MKRTFENRLRRLEANTPQVIAPRYVFTPWPLEDGEPERLLADWQGAVAEGRAVVMGETLMFRGERLTMEQWQTKWGHA
jgi:hypothetical protein